MDEDRGLRTHPIAPGDNSSDGQHRESGSNTSGDARGIRSIPDAYRVGQESGGEQAQSVRGVEVDSDMGSDDDD